MTVGNAEWLVTDGERVVGPVSLDLISKGIDSGKLSPEALVRHRDSTEWRAACEVPELAGGPGSDALGFDADDRAAIDLVDGAASIGEAALFALAGAVERVGCTGGLLHMARGGLFETRCAHGPGAADALGRLIASVDPTVLAVARERAWADPPRPDASTTAARLEKLGVLRTAILALPIRFGGRLAGILEVSLDRPFGGREIAMLERLLRGIELVARRS
jgi:GAF domain-containing protein